MSTTAAAALLGLEGHAQHRAGQQRGDAGLGVGSAPPGSGTRANTVPAARPASPRAPSPSWALRRNTSVTPGGGAGTGVARGDDVGPRLVPRPCSPASVPVVTGATVGLPGAGSLPHRAAACSPPRLLALAAGADGRRRRDAGDARPSSRALAARRTVERSVHEAYPGLAFGNVACPAGIQRARGVSFTCTVQLPGTFLVVDAKQTDGSGTIALSTQQALIPTAVAAGLHRAERVAPRDGRLRARAVPRVAHAGQTIDCGTTLADGTARAVQLTVQDTAGNVTLARRDLSPRCSVAARLPRAT